MFAMTMLRAVFIILACLAISAFVVEGPRDKSSDALTALHEAPRWGLSSGSLLTTGERGLGGGLEYAIDESVCALSFIDRPACADVHRAIREALAEWGSGHPLVYFTDITGKVAPDYPLGVFGQSNQGAEIDFYGAMPEEFPPFQLAVTTGYTLFYERPQTAMILTNGAVMHHGSMIESADVRFNASRCYYLDRAKARPACIHFPSLVLHEVSHALGIGHPDENVALNLDTDTDPDNEIPINCRAPVQGLRVSPRINGANVSHGRDVQGPGRWSRGLTWDDVAARDALYPHCGIQRIERFSGSWGAYARSAAGHEGRAQSEKDASTASRKALSQCESGGHDCHLIASFAACFAYATDVEGRAGLARSARSDHARVDAVLACQEQGGDCRVAAEFCAFE